MIWRDDDDKRDEQQKKIEYARELEQQIELRKALEREQQKQQHEWERRFVEPRDAQSPAKWWTELRASEPPSRAARLGFHMDASAFPSAGSAAVKTGATPSLPSGTAARQRFHATLGDPLASHDRLREKAQQIEWKRILDEQLREKERRKQLEAEQKWLRERDEAEEERRMQRELQVRAQRKLGIHDAFSAQDYVAIPSPPAPTRRADAANGEDGLQDGYTTLDPRTTLLPPPAPVHVRGSDSVDFHFRRAMGLQDAPPQMQQQQPQPLHEMTARDSTGTSIAHEYRALLVEIRRERDELRRERDELRREKEELRMERALMQMENEKMATLLESQRHMTDQRLESIARLDRALETRTPPEVLGVDDEPPVTPRYARKQATPSRRPTRLPSPLHVVHRDHSIQQLRPSDAFSRPPQQQQPSPVNRRPGGAMSMADFAPPSSSTTNLRSPSARAIDALLARRHERFRLREQHENPLERSLNGESEFVALSPHVVREIRQYSAAPRITETRSPSASMMDPRRERANPLRNSRVIKSRGFYDLNREDAQPQPRAAWQQQQQSQPHHQQRTLVDHHSPLRTRGGRRGEASSESEHSEEEEEEEDDDRAQRRPRRSSEYSEEEDDESYDFDHDEVEEQEAQEEEEDGDDPVMGDGLTNTSRSDFALSRSLFQVQVLVKDQA